LRTEREPCRVNVLGCLLGTALERIQAFKLRRFGAHHAQHDALFLGHEAQRREVAGARRVELEQKVIDPGGAEELLGNRIVAAFGEVLALVIAAAHVHTDHHPAGAVSHRLVDRTHVEIDQPLRVLPFGLDLCPRGRVAKHGERDFIQLHVACSGLGEVGDLLLVDSAQIGEELRGVGVNAGLRVLRSAPEVHGRRRRQRDLGREVGDAAQELRDEIELVRGASHEFDQQAFLAGELTPVFFGSAINNFGVQELLDYFVDIAPGPQPRATDVRKVEASEEKFSGFVFKIQANMDPQHRDRIAFLRVCSGHYEKGMKMFQVRLGKDVKIANAITFMASEREQIEEAYPGDIIGLHNHGTIQIGDTFSEGEVFKYTGIPNFAPELFRRVRLKDPLRMKALQKGLDQLSEEGASQVFRPLNSNDIIVGAVGVLQFDVVAFRLKSEYGVEAGFEAVNVTAARWVDCDDDKKLAEFKKKASENLALDAGNSLTYLAPTRVNLDLTIERWPDIRFHATREH